MGKPDDKDNFQEQLLFELRRIANALWQQVFLERKELQNHVIDVSLTQGDNLMAINGIQVGATGNFTIGMVPATNFIPLPTPPTVTVDDPLVTLGPVDPTSFKFDATVSSTDTGASFNATVAWTNDKGTSGTHVFNIPILPTVVTPTSVTDVTLDQNS